ncbi:MAG: hypothetical protein JXJ22_12525 [Bacteroidales bacterium]|nr:hypothetical protein [Bacteroidales bacterium]
MKTKSLLITVFAIIILISSCIPSLHPLYTKKDLILDNSIVGNWISGESDSDQSNWNITKYQKKYRPGPQLNNPDDDEDKLYRLEYIECGDTIGFNLYVLKLGDYVYFDFYPFDYESKNDMRNMHLFPVHTFAKVEIQQEQIILHQFDIGFLEELIKQNKIKISHEKSGLNIILTAPTEELQKFVKKYANDENAFIDPTILSRKI